MRIKIFRRGQSYVTLQQIWRSLGGWTLVEERTAEAAGHCGTRSSAEQKQGVEAVAVDMWEPLIQTIQTRCPRRTSCMTSFMQQISGEAVDKVRRQEHKELLAQGDETLKGTRQLWLYNPQNFESGTTGGVRRVKDLS